MKPAQQDINIRRPVWEALSSLFLDTDVADLRNWRAEILAASPYPLDTLEAILSEEVYPVCNANLHSVAGVWDGFDMQWLEAEILKHRDSKWSWCRLLKLGKRFSAQDAEWQATKTVVTTIRSAKDA